MVDKMKRSLQTSHMSRKQLELDNIRLLKQKQHLEGEITQGVRITAFTIIFAAVILGFWISSMADNADLKHDLESKILISKNMAGTYYEGGSIIVRFDAHDQKQVAFVKQLEVLCLQLNIKSCMNAKDILPIKQTKKSSPMTDQEFAERINTPR